MKKSYLNIAMAKQKRKEKEAEEERNAYEEEMRMITEKFNDAIFYKRLFEKSRSVERHWGWTLLLIQFLTLPLIILFPNAYMLLWGINFGCMIGVLLNTIFFFADFRPFWNREMKRRFGKWEDLLAIQKKR